MPSIGLASSKVSSFFDGDVDRDPQWIGTFGVTQVGD